ncbi:MAG: phenylalanine--tRNA ligase subunit beta [Xanthomonadaceae bacterium]|jgi:phenylalanyl-tRNA synthetase beta chain|nr:phenylalanine--tRNA ligase subunit beta [Xanthomonadaceae bacterium]
MKFSENWLRSHVPVQADRNELVTTLTAIGLEVEDVVTLGASLDRVVVARIIEAERHPEADRLQVCKVEAGLEQPLQIVCGAPNARAGLIAPLALLGAQIGDLTIKPAKLRGIESNGMLCSAKELGLDNDASGLLELPEDAPIGMPLRDYLHLPDASIEIKLTPNRADCFSVRGIAYDVAAACGSAVAAFDVSAVPAASARALPVELHAGAKAPRYCGRVIEHVDANTRTPLWMAERLRRSGIRPVSFLVDVTQYIMLELGQPMHAYDLDTLRGPVGVRRARAGEPLALLDGRQITLDDEFLIITDADRPIALAGLMGGMDTRVTENTRHVFLEAAYFAPASIMGRGRRLGLHTDAGHRFERGVDPELSLQAIEVATRLITELTGGTPGPTMEASLPEYLPQPVPIRLRRDRIARVLGLTMEDTEIERILSALGMRVETLPDGWKVTPPSRRFDISIEEDLIEELARIHGYDRIPTTLPGTATQVSAPAETRLDDADIRRQFVARDYLETINYAFVDDALLQEWQCQQHTVPLANPLSAELAVMRPSLLPGLIMALGRNLSRQAERVRLFEIGKVFSSPSSAQADAPPAETLRIAAAICGSADAEQWATTARKADFYDLKGDLESLAISIGTALEFVPSEQPFGHPGRSADIYRTDDAGQRQRLGWIGQLHPRLQRALDIGTEIIAFELDADRLRQRTLPEAAELSRFPSVRRDLAFIVPNHVSWAMISATVHTNVGTLLRELRLFDRYTGTGIEPGYKSLAIGLILQDNSRTLTDRDVDSVTDGLIAALDRDHSARIRS